MITVVAHGNAQRAGGYFEEHLSQDEYYRQGEIRPGQWIGEGVTRLGLQESARVERAAFMALCENRHPVENTQLTLRQNAEGQRRIYYDFTCSAPKSVSVLAVTLGDDRLIEAHHEASRVAFRELQSEAATRVRKKGRQENRTTGTLVAAEFTHTTSRALDPQLHTHFTVFNATYDPTEGCWKALQSGPLYEAVGYATAVYRNDLARRVEAMGYRIEPAEHGWQIQGVSAEVQERFSKRSAQRDQVVRAMEERLGRSLTHDEVSLAVHQSRDRKVKGLSTAAIREHQRAQLTPQELSGLGQLCSRDTTGRPTLRQHPGDSVEYALAHVFERASVVPEREVLTAALEHGWGRSDLEALKRSLREHPEVVRTDRGLSTRAILASEVELIRTVNAARESMGPLNVAFTPSASLGQDQQRALGHLLQTPDRIVGLRGLAGSGKTTTLQELARACEAAGYSMVWCAPTAAATEVLRAEGFKAVTLSAFLANPTRGLGPRDVVVLDEAGAVGVEAMSKLFMATPQSRVILCGDSGQHAPVARGDAFRLLEEHSRLSCGLLSEIRRQRTAGYRQAVEWAAERKTAAAFTQLQRLEAIESVPQAGIPEAAATAYVAARAEGRSVLMVAPTWEEIGRITHSVRQSLKATGELGSKDQEIRVFDSLSWTEAQRGDPARYRVGLQVRFHRRKGGFESGETVEVVGCGTSVEVRRADGSVRRLPAVELADAMDVGEPRRLPVAVGDRLLLQANVRKRFTNGEVVEVKEVQGDSIRLKDGRTLPGSYRTFTHGYAVTSHASQGRTVDEVIVVASSRSLAAVSQEQFYVSISRARDRCRVLTDDLDRLRSHVTRSSVRVSAYEAMQGQGRLRQLPHSLRQGIRQWWFRARQRIGQVVERVERLSPVRRLRRRLQHPVPRQIRTHGKTETHSSSMRH